MPLESAAVVGVLLSVLAFLLVSQTGDLLYVARGRRVEDAYQRYVANLDAFRGRLLEDMRHASLDVEAELGEKPAAVLYGYQIIPKILPNPRRPEKQGPPAPVSYSWVRTEKMIEAEEAKIRFSEQLGIREKISRYRELAANQKLIDQHIQYNWLWQKAIDEDKPRFDRDTVRFDTVVQGKADPGRIPPARAPFIQIRQPDQSSWIIRVPMYTDIRDTDFLHQAKEAIEEMWRYSDERNHFQVEVEFKQIAPETIYAPEQPQATGSHIDLQKHAARFPEGAGILTTGVSSLHVSGRYIALGPTGITKTTLAHEFGHILGFSDEYVRGYCNLGPGGEDGYEVLEIVPDIEDIMCDPGWGRVQRRHFEALITAK